MTDHPTLPVVDPLDRAAINAALVRWGTRAKPPGSLGQLEDLAVRLAGISGTCPPVSGGGLRGS